MSIKRFLTVYTLQLGLICLVIGIVLTILGAFGVFFHDFLKDQELKSIIDIIDSVGDWIYWCILIGPVLIIAGGWYFFDNISKRREFKELIKTTSKAKIIRNLDRIEFLAWKLTAEHQSQLAKKKRKFNIK